MKKIAFFFLLGIIACNSPTNKKSFTTVFEKSEGTETATYQEAIAYYKKLADSYAEIEMREMGTTDSGFPLHLVVLNLDKEFDFNTIHQSKKNVLLINNAIHPGESDGVDASMLLLRDFVQNKEKHAAIKNTVIAIIPIYNIGGALNRNRSSRANQNGPKEYGFRGNAQNYDLNRDFIKNDTKNAASFAEIFHTVQPDVFIENHVSNGADYQYNITHLCTQHNKLGNALGKFLHTEMTPFIENTMRKKNTAITPYVNVYGRTPDTGFTQFMDHPRYSSGYTTLFNTLGLMVETHMLKPYKTRVTATYTLLETSIEFIAKEGDRIQQLRAHALEEVLSKKSYPIAYAVDKTQYRTLQFEGYEGSYIPSEVTNGKRLLYDRTKPFTKPVPYFNQFKPSKEITIPAGYIIPQGWWKVLERLNSNRIEYTAFKKDTTLVVEVSRIIDFKTRTAPYEGHYLHYNTTVEKTTETRAFRKGDYYIPIAQKGARYLMETLEPEAPDSFFNWNFFDTVLQQKEGFSSYVFEDLAAAFLKENPDIKEQLEEKKAQEPAFAKNSYAQLDFIFKQTPHYEKVHKMIPVFRVLNNKHMKKSLILVLLLAYTVRCTKTPVKQQVFNAVQWQAKDGKDYIYRTAMLDNVLHNDTIRDLNQTQLLDLLGKPDYIRAAHLYYRIDETRLGNWTLHTKTMVIQLTEDQKIAWIKVHE